MSLFPPMQDDLALRVRLTLNSAGHPILRQVKVEQEDGKIVLSGKLPSFYMKQVAQTLVSSVDGVRRLDNRVEVVRTAVSI